MKCRINFSGLSEGENMLGTPYTSFQSVSCGEEQTAYPYPNSPDLYYAWRELGFNLIRLPVAWGYIQEGLQGPLNQTTLGQLDHLVDVITGDGSTAIVDLVSRLPSFWPGVVALMVSSIIMRDITVLLSASPLTSCPMRRLK